MTPQAIAALSDRTFRMLTEQASAKWRVIETSKGRQSFGSGYERDTAAEAHTLAQRMNNHRKWYKGYDSITRISVVAPDGTVTDYYRYTPQGSH